MKTNNHPSASKWGKPPESGRAKYHQRYAGEIYLSDFNTCHPGGNIAKRILRAGQFDESCRINDLLRQIRRDSL